jgi:membrane protein YdbS with pleckstrin-like domain
VIVSAAVLLAAVLIVALAYESLAGWLRIVVFVVAIVAAWKTVNAVGNMLRTHLVVTDQRIFGASGWPKAKHMTLPLTDVDSVDAKRSAVGSVLGYGTIVVNATGRGNLRVEYPQIAGAAKLAQDIRAQLARPTVRPTAARTP